MPLILLQSTCTEERLGSFCQNELDILTSDDHEGVVFDFNLGSNDQLDVIQRQVDINLCDQSEQAVPFSVKLEWDTEPDLVCGLIAYRNCLEFKKSFEMSYHWWDIDILVNRNAQVLIEGKVTELESISSAVKRSLDELLKAKKVHRIFYQVNWEKGTSRVEIFNVFHEVFKGHLMKAEEISRALFGAEPCDLNPNQRAQIKDSLQLYLLVTDIEKAPSFKPSHEEKAQPFN